MNKLVISWGQNITRSSSLADKLAAKDLHFKPYFKNRNLKIFNYAISSFRMLYALIMHKPKLVVVVLPPVFLLYVVFLYGFFRKIDIVADLHNGVLRAEWAKWPLIPFLLRKCKIVLSHNYQIQTKINNHFGLDRNSKVLTDPLKNYSFDENLCSDFIKPGKVNVLVPVSYAKDEPIKEIVAAESALCNDFNFILTGNYTKMFSEDYVLSSSITFTGFISYEEYESLLCLCDLTLCLTTDDDIQMCAVIESISANKSFICANNSVNRHLFSDYYFDLVDCEVSSIVNGLNSFKKTPASSFETINNEKYSRLWQESFNALFEK
jgi:hypothetical protein